jgi:Peptidase MA superfamily
MRLSLYLFTLTAALLVLLTPAPSQAASDLKVTDRGVFIAFPDRISFNAQVTSSLPIAQIVLEYGVVKRTCGDITAKAFPTFVPGTTIDVNWTWEMLQTGSEPPGALIWYRWRVTDSAGNSVVSEDKQVSWLDSRSPWQQISRGDLTLHWYSGSPAFAEELLSTAVSGIEQLAEFTGVRPQSPIDLYIYANTRQMRDALLYEPSWAGGVAFPANNITIIGISPDYLDWGKRTVVHELTHLIVGQITFSCGENVPTWLDEGIAVFAEGGLDDYSNEAFQRAIANNSLLSVRSLSNGFSQHPDVADLSYSQSYSLVSYLVRGFGSAKLLALFANLRDGMTVEAGLQAAYGFNLDGLEDSWRASIGAAARRNVAPTATPVPTLVPTAQAMAAPPPGPPRQPTPTGLPTAAPTAAIAGAAAPQLAEQPLAPAPAAVVVRPSPLPQLLGAGLIFLIGLSLTGLAAWKLFGAR